jgi:hypothetical protein
LSNGKLNESNKSAQNESINTFINGKFQAITSTFSKSLANCNAAAKVPRLKCILDLMDYVKDADQKPFLRQILPEVILCIREVNHKSREAAFELLNSMLRLWQKLGLKLNPPVSETDSLNEFVHLVMIGLAGSTNMVSCTCLALSSLTNEFRGNKLIKLLKYNKHEPYRNLINVNSLQTNYDLNCFYSNKVQT